MFAISEQVSKDRFKMYCGILVLVGWWVWFLLVFLFLGGWVLVSLFSMLSGYGLPEFS